VTSFDGTAAPRIGVFADCTDYSMPILDLARAVEDRGFSGLFLNEHPHLPVDHPRSQFPGGGEISRRYSHFWDPYVALSFVAAQTALDVGTCISLVGEHDPIALAKAVATLDVLSSGRLLLGVGFGWHREEFEDHGHSARVRAAVVEESVRLMRELWTSEVGAFSGEFVRVSPSYSWPKPVQRPHPPVLLGVRASERNFRRIATWCDGWIPMGTPSFGDGGFAREIGELRSEWERAGHNPARLQVMVQLTTVALEDMPALVTQALDLGVQRVAFKVHDGDTDETLAYLDEAENVFTKAFP
jgi:probable F420-dependent oxidoreductase